MKYCVSWLLLIWISLGSSLSTANEQIAKVFDTVISPHIDNGYVYYNRIDNASLDNLVAQVANYSVDERNLKQSLAFYINAYNILTIKGIKQGDGPHSFFSRRTFFKGNKYVVSGKTMNLDTLEHKIMRPLNEPRIHFALVCAALSCPPLRSEAYRAEILDKQLDDQAITFINNKEKNSFDIENNKANISSIFKWFKEDFVIQGNTLSEYIAPFVKDKNIQQLLTDNKLDINFKKYSWRLNGER
jgi:hypothetical protein